jgi:hypothetical protein
MARMARISSFSIRFLAIALIFTANPIDGAFARPPVKLSKKYFCEHLFKSEDVRVRADIEEPIEKNGVKVGVGSRMRIRVAAGKTVEGLFLGRLVNRQRQSTDYLFYHYEDDLLYVIPQAKLRIRFEGKTVGSSSLQPILDPIEQAGETCMAYALDHMVHQIDLNELDGTGILRDRLSTEEGRTRLLVEFVSEYYLNLRRRNNANGILNDELHEIFDTVLKKKASKLGLKCRVLKYQDPKRLVAAITKAMDAGSPVLLEFNIGAWMLETKTQVIDPDERFGEDRRLWIPQKKGEAPGGGHAIVASQYFTSPSGRLKFLVQDSDWTEPRIWDVENYFIERYESSGMMAHVCRAK